MMRNGWGEDGWRDRYEGRRFEGGGHPPRHEWDERDMRGHDHPPERRPDERMGRDEHRAIGDDRGPWMRSQQSMRGRDPRGDDELSRSHGEAPIVKVIEVLAQSPHSWEDAARRAVAEASRTVRDIKSIWIKDMNAIVSHDRIVEFRIVAKISFAIRSEDRSRRQHV